MSLPDAVALDCEMVIGENGEYLAAQVAIVDEYGHEVYNTYVRQTNVADYVTHITGLNESHLKQGRYIENVKYDVARIIQGCLLVGHGVDNDLKCLGLRHPEWDKRDTAEYFKTKRGFLKLKHLAHKHLGLSIQNGAHDALEDASACMKLYMLFQDEWERTTLHFPFENRPKLNLNNLPEEYEIDYESEYDYDNDDIIHHGFSDSD